MNKLLPLTLLVIGGFLIACNNNNVNTDDNKPEEKPAETHKWKTSWSHDEKYHWHDSEDESFKFVKDKEEHRWNDGVISKPATEDEAGLKTYTCEVCSATKTEVIDKLAHTHVLSVEWSSNGQNHWKTCTGCDEKFELGIHIGGSATCAEQAICEKCHQHYGPLDEHNYGSLIPAIEPTCEQEGRAAYYQCSECHKYFNEYKEETTLEALVIPVDTLYGDLIPQVDASCEETGLKAHYHCERCGKYYTEDKEETTLEALVIPAKGHAYGDLIAKVDSTCTNDGLEAHYQCSECHKYFDADKVEVNYDDLLIDAGHKYTITHHDFVAVWKECEICHQTTSKSLLEWTIGAVSGGARVDTNELDEERNVSVWDGSSASTSLSGSGTIASPYLIQSANDLAYFANQVIGGNIYTSKYIKMTKSVDLTNHPLVIGGWESSISFDGNFDADKNYILNMNLTSAQAANGTNVVALFPTTGSNSVIKNLAVSGSVSGVGGIGGIAGYINGAVENCYNLATISGSGANVGGIVGGTYNAGASITNCYNFGEVISSLGTSNAAGIIGLFKGTISGSENHGKINVQGTAGGIAGVGSGTISTCANYGQIIAPAGYVGGIIGVTNSTGVTITNSNNSGEIKSKLFSGGIIGTVNHKNGDTLTNCVNNGQIECTGTCIGGIIGAPISFADDYMASLSNCVNNGLVKGGNRVGSLVGWFPAASYNDCQNKGTIVDYASSWKNNDQRHELAEKEELTWEIGQISAGTRTDTNQFGFTRTVSIWDGSSASTSLSGTGTNADPYLIQSANDLAYFASEVSSTTNQYTGKYVKMMVSVDLNEHPLVIGGWDSNISFNGNFDGNNNFVLNMSLTSDQAANGNNVVALFPTTGSSSVIKNLAVTGSISGNDGIGGIAGYINGAVENCYNFASITAEGSNIGGIAGGTYTANAAITYCSNFGSISSTKAESSIGGMIGLFKGNVKYCSNYGTIDARMNVGGIAGIGSGNISDCANFASVIGTAHVGGMIGVTNSTGVTITNCTNNGNVIGSNSTGYTGGMIGTINHKNGDTLTNCVNNGDIRSLGNGIGGIIGSTLTSDSGYTARLIDCVNNGTIQGSNKVGGIAGQLFGTYANCVNNGQIICTYDDHGDLFGYGEMTEE